MILVLFMEKLAKSSLFSLLCLLSLLSYLGVFVFSAGCSPVPPVDLEHELVILSDGALSSESGTQTDSADISASHEHQTDTQIAQEDTTENPAAQEPSAPDIASSEDPERATTDATPDTVVEASPEPTIDVVSDKPSSPESAPGPQWIGESCTQDADCGYVGGRCLRESTGYPKGYCTQDCSTTCPDRNGKPYTFCISNAANQGYCVSQCEQSPCRAGYVCEARNRHNDTTKQRSVCVPEPATNPGTSITVLMIGDSQSSGTQFAKTLVDFFRNPGKSCAGAKTQNNKVFSYARVSSAARHWSELSGSSKDWMCQNTTVYVNGTATQNTTGAQLCTGITNTAKSVFQKLIDTHKANAFLVQLGSNDIGFSESYVKGKIKQMLDQMPLGSLCFWAVPTFSSSKYLAAKRDIERWIKETFQGYSRLTCHAITSIDEMSKQTTCSSFYGSDGLHLTTCGSQLWGQLVAQKICALHKL